MLFKFKSKACADLIMLEADARRILKAMIGEDPIQGIVLAADLAQALSRLDVAVTQDEVLRKIRADEARMRPSDQNEDREEEVALPVVRLAQRAAPMQQMLRRCLAEKTDLVWGV